MRARRPGRFSRAWQRQRAEQADAEHAETMTTLGLIGRIISSRGMYIVPRPPPAQPGEQIQPYRGFRDGRSRWRPAGTGYDEPVEPDEQGPRGPGNEHPWLDDLDEDLPSTGPVLGATEPDSSRE